MAQFVITNKNGGNEQVEADSYSLEDGFFNFVKEESTGDTDVLTVGAAYVYTIRRS